MIMYEQYSLPIRDKYYCNCGLIETSFSQVSSKARVGGCGWMCTYVWGCGGVWGCVGEGWAG